MNSVPTTKHFGIGIDTARYGHHVSFMDENKRTAAKAIHFTESADGYQALLKAHYDKRKADPIESLAGARFAVVERPSAVQQPPPQFAVLRDAVAQMEASATARTALINQLHNMLARALAGTGSDRQRYFVNGNPSTAAKVSHRTARCGRSNRFDRQDGDD